MPVSGEHRAPRADVVDVALAVGVPEVGARGALEEHRRAADCAKGAHWRVDAARDAGLRALEKLVALLHWKSLRYAAARSPMSGASKRSESTARRLAPAAIRVGALSSVTPPIAQRGTPRSFLNRLSGARTASGLVGEGNTLPNAM